MKSSATTLFAGRLRAGGRRQPSVYFVAEFSRPFKDLRRFQADSSQGVGFVDSAATMSNPDARTISGQLRRSVSAVLNHRRRAGAGEDCIRSELRAARRATACGRSADGISTASTSRREDAWAKKLNQIEVTGGTEKEKMLFYSCLFHSFASPRLVARKGEQFRGLDGKSQDGRLRPLRPGAVLGYRPQPDRAAHPARART